MRDCEQHEIRISAWMDEELDREGQEAMLDHLVRCPGCRDFYLGARGLAGLAAAVRTPTRAPAPSPEVWRRIEQSARPPKIGRGTHGVAAWTRRVPIRGWAVAAAAALLVIFGSLVRRERMPMGPTSDAMTEIRLGGNPAGMDDARFVELTKEVLGSNRRYRTAFYEVMRQVVLDSEEREGSADVLPPSADARHAAELPETRGGPS